VNFSEYVIPVPGGFAAGAAFLDLETEKVPCEYVLANGERLRRRWSVLAAGVARAGEIRLLDWADSEDSFLAAIAEAAGTGPIVYAATRQFDEMILRGQFTNARRAHAASAFYPAMPGAADREWRNLGRLPEVQRGADVASHDVPERFRNGGYRRCMVHLLRDVAELVLVAGSPNAEAEAWCRRVLADYCFAAAEIFGGEDEVER
jgi:hypothetical protein